MELQDFQMGDKVIADNNMHNLQTFGLPAYLSGGVLTVTGFTKKRVKCDWDGGKPFHIPPELLRKVKNNK